MQVLEPSPKIATGLAFRSRGKNTSDPDLHAEDPRWQLALRIAASGSLGRSRLLTDFLLYIVDRHIRNRTDEITEPQIGVLVFGRAEGYDSNDDNIVRSYARNLRKRIDEYFALEGRGETLRLEIPRGGYTPIFSDLKAEIQSSPDTSTAPVISSSNIAAQENASQPRVNKLEPEEEADETLRGAMSPVAVSWLRRVAGDFARPQVLFILCTGILFGVLLSFLISLIQHVIPPEEAASHLLWSQLFSNDHDTFIVPSDDGLVIMQRLIPRPLELATYVNGTYRTDVKTSGTPADEEILKLGRRRYTSVVDLDFVGHLAQLKEVVPERMMVRYARDLRIDDLRAGNAVLIGSNEANPWIELFQPQLNFFFRFQSGVDKQSEIVNVHPRPGEMPAYLNPGNGYTYGIIAYLPNLNDSGHVLIVGGLNMAGTEAATAFLMKPSLMLPTLQRARTADGKLQPFELMVGASNVATNASTPHAILERIGLPHTP